jgi:endonuclease/exonuclease/phosphatase family metal-dependent hydrolase
MKVITLNLRNFTDDHWTERLPLICNDIINSKADILAFQEVRGYIDSTVGPDMAQQVQTYLSDSGYPYPCLYEQQAMVYSSQGVWEGLAILSKEPFLDKGYEVLPLGTGSDGNTRIMLWASFKLLDGSFFVSNNHFSYDSNQALGNAEHVLLYLSQPKFNIPGLLVGDLNVTPDDQTIVYMTKKNWCDIWYELYPAEDGFTFPAGAADERIDYQWKNPNFIKTIQSIEILFTDKDTVTNEYPSDHYGVMTTF